MDGGEMDKTDKERAARGVNCLFFGSVLIFTGLLNSMISMKAGIPAGGYTYIMLGSGAALLLAGRLLRR